MIIDLHNDLLSFLNEKPGRSIDDTASRSSYPQMQQGGIKLQVLAIFSITGHSSVAKGQAQVDQYLNLLQNYPTLFAPYRNQLDSPQIHLLPAIENASSFATESEPLKESIRRLEGYIAQIGSPLYISLTWDNENRFGGGNASTAGLKEDGKHLLEWMDGKKIAIDLSHTSDKLADNILNFTLQQGLNIPVIASHSNFRTISNYPRNLPEEIAKEIIQRKGLIGLNFFAPFVHPTDPLSIVRHVEYALSLGAKDALCFGADFFHDGDFSIIREKYQRETAFYPELGNASVYPSVLQLFQDKLKLSPDQLNKIAYQNALEFLSKMN
jgi:membrane dipeptidase